MLFRNAHLVLPDRISKEPYAPSVKQGDVGKRGLIRLRVALTERAEDRSSSRRCVMGMAEVDQHASESGACGLGDVCPKHIDLR